MTAKHAIIELVKALKASNFLTPNNEHKILIALDQKEGAS